MPDPAAVQSMFGRIAVRYDVANRLLSGGLDVWWRRRLVAAVRRGNPRDVLDLATGSGDVAFALARMLPRETAILGLDFCQPMLDQAEVKKAAADGRYPNVTFRQGDGLALPLPDASFDAVTISFGLRNLADRARGLREMRRVLRPGGQIVVLEFSQPRAWFRPLYYFYLRRVLPRVAGWMTGDRAAYVYLNDSIEQFPDRAAIAAEMRAAGFADVQAVPLTLGTVALHSGRKPAS
ncbi:MAG: bifunctional demethylmenaquinone methyltransferase/2-methoxy-6-polyprenyl-1,4-benzoquinol methylase UbiE [Opitutaceae bacterium]|nr:bifunctional demethylmenaquinone methyltransferase/2-methoxy-6-polyprenyl-1,4-benzoquinol methylase UbiE [Opitutaceae bacterium]